MEINITRISIVRLSYGCDRVSVYTDLPCPFPPEFDKELLSLDFKVARGNGPEYVWKVFGIDAELIEGPTPL